MKNEKETNLDFALEVLITFTLTFFVVGVVFFITTMFKDYGPSEYEKERIASLKGKELLRVKGCIACHSLDGSPMIGPSFQGIWGGTSTVIENGEEKTVKVDKDYIHEAILEPQKTIVKGYEDQEMVVPVPVSEEDIKYIISYFKLPIKDEPQEIEK